MELRNVVPMLVTAAAVVGKCVVFSCEIVSVDVEVELSRAATARRLSNRVICRFRATAQAHKLSFEFQMQ